MENVLYAKFSSERKKEFQILTKIVLEKEQKHLYKFALNEKARSHINNIIINKEKIKKIEDNNIKVVNATKICDDQIELEYIDGKTLDNIIVEKLCNNEDSDTLDIIMHFINMIKPEKRFVVSDEFKNVFGEINITEFNFLCDDISNVDLLFGNVIIKDDIYYISDYEWVFDFQVPFEYIIFRSLELNTEISIWGTKVKNEVFSRLGIDESMRIMFYNMEKNFQNYVSGNKILDIYFDKKESYAVPINGIEIAKYIHTIETFANSVKRENRMNIYNGINDIIDLRFEIDRSIEKLILLIKNGPCICKIEKCLGKRKNEFFSVEIESNSDFSVNDNYYFGNLGPELCLNNNNFDFIEIQIRVYYHNTGVISQYIEKIKESNKLNNDLNVKNNIIDDYERRISDYEKMIADIRRKRWFGIYHRLSDVKNKLFKN